MGSVGQLALLVAVFQDVHIVTWVQHCLITFCPFCYKSICLTVRHLLRYWEHNAHSTPQNPFLNSSISRDHAWPLSFFRLLGKEMSIALTCLAGQGLQPPRTSKGRNENQTNLNWYTQPQTPQFSHRWILLQVTTKYAWTTEDHGISTVSNRDWSTAASNLGPDLEVTANKQRNKAIWKFNPSNSGRVYGVRSGTDSTREVTQLLQVFRCTQIPAGLGLSASRVSWIALLFSSPFLPLRNGFLYSPFC